jgi:hypothetical protein
MGGTTIRRGGAQRNSATPFALWQPLYAQYGIATFPVGEDKRPAVRGYPRVGLRASHELASKFADAQALGFMCGSRNKVTVLDIDTPDERVLADAIGRHGATPLIVRTASGKWHAYYRHGGERRHIRPWQGLPIDVLGQGGFVIAPPSIAHGGQYQFIEGSLDKINQLPVMRGLVEDRSSAKVEEGRRNDTLFRHCMGQAHHCDDLDALLDVARTFNQHCNPPMSDAEVIKTARSAWRYQVGGRNRVGQHGAWFPTAEVDRMIQHPDALILLMFLRAHEGPWATFMVANGLADTFRWTRKRLAAARDGLLALGYVKRVRQAGYRSAALYKWSPPTAKKWGGQK